MTVSSRHDEVRRVLILTLIANLLVAAAKLLIGVLTASLAMIADGVHSSLDGMSNVVGLVGNALAARPPDEDHPYGHQRFETVASMLIGGILILTGWEIVTSSVNRIFQQSTPEITSLNFIVMLVTLAINIFIAFYERREALRLRSEVLLADSAHTRSDILVSLTVIVSLIAVRWGLGWVDAATAIAVVGLIGVAAWRIVRRSVDVLVDRAAVDAEQVRAVAEDVPGLGRVLRVRSRGSMDDVHVDIDVQVEPATTTELSASLTREVRHRLRQKISGLSDIQIHFIPVREGPLDYALVARAEADALGLGIHEVIPSQAEDGLILDLHVEVAPEQTVGEAHAQVTIFEDRMKKALPELKRIVTHIEPAHVSEEIPADYKHAHDLADKALWIARDIYPDNFWHDVDIRPESDGGFALSLHCHVEEWMPLEDAHRLAENVETSIKAALPDLHRVTIHTEPYNT